ncbi:MAG: DUF2339 domain-containing protein, partial [Planctomycetota bacterium]
EVATGDIDAGRKTDLAPEKAAAIEKARQLWEQQIGTRWILIAGVITTFFGVAFFLRYAYLHFSISDLGKVIIAAVCGFIALAAGEITRRRGYGVVAKGVTALGFAILYAVVFAAQQFYGLIGSRPAFALAAMVTAATMAYAVILDEILIAFLSLLGGFLTPAIVSTGQNLPMPLFIYVTVLSVGAILCAYYRKWRAVDWLSYIGTFSLYTGWFERFYRPAVQTAGGPPEQIAIALGWLAVFFVIYLLMPILYELAKRVKTRKEDVLLVLANAAVVFYYLWTILFDRYRAQLAFCALGLCGAHLAMMAVVTRRCKDDLNLQHVLLAIGLFFLTIAVPVYLKMYAVTIAWAAEGVILAMIGLRYRSVLTQVGAAAALLLSCGNLLLRLPMHQHNFNFVINPAFGTWCLVAAAMFVCHLLYRQLSESEEHPYGVVAQILYALAVIWLFAAATMEWYWHCRYNVPDGANYLWRGQMVIFAAAVLLSVIRPLRPAGIICDALAGLAVAAGSLFAAVFVLTNFHKARFTIFVNLDFAAVLVFVAALSVYHVICRRISQSPDDRNGWMAQVLFALIGLLLFMAATMEWYCHCRHNLGAAGQLHHISRGQVIIFAAIALLFAIRPLCPRGELAEVLSLISLGAGSIFTLIALTKLHTRSFVIFANPDFAVMLVFIMVMLLCHIKYRLSSGSDKDLADPVSQTIYCVLGLLLLCLVAAEWYWHCRYNLQADVLSSAFIKGQVIIFSIILLPFVVRPICPQGIASKILAMTLAGAGAMFTMITFPQAHKNNYVIFANVNFGIVLLFVATLFLSAWLLNRTRNQERHNRKVAIAFALSAIFVLWILLNEEIYLYWYCRNRFSRPLANWQFLAHMYISVMWAVYGALLMIVGFWRRIRLLRYIAIGLFALLLGKVFIWDTRTMGNVYRIAAFLATGLTLVAMSYVYQFLKKKGFFETMLPDKNVNA